MRVPSVSFPVAAAFLFVLNLCTATAEDIKVPLSNIRLVSVKLSFNDIENLAVEKIEILEKLNRTSREHLPNLSTLIIPDTWKRERLLTYGPLPEKYSWAKNLPKLMVVHLPMQCFGAYEYGNLVRWGAVSSGREEFPTPSGMFHLNWKARERVSTLNEDWLLKWYFNFENMRGLAIHLFTLPGRPASHACIRMLERDAVWAYNWGEEWKLDQTGTRILKHGTPLLIIGKYEYNGPPPWRDLEKAKKKVELPSFPVVTMGNPRRDLNARVVTTAISDRAVMPVDLIIISLILDKINLP